MLNPNSQMMPPRNQQNFGGNDNNGAKKLPNPANFKIVKCKNFERGNLIYQFF